MSVPDPLVPPERFILAYASLVVIVGVIVSLAWVELHALRLLCVYSAFTNVRPLVQHSRKLLRKKAHGSHSSNVEDSEERGVRTVFGEAGGGVGGHG